MVKKVRVKEVFRKQQYQSRLTSIIPLYHYDPGCGGAPWIAAWTGHRFLACTSRISAPIPPRLPTNELHAFSLLWGPSYQLNLAICLPRE